MYFDYFYFYVILLCLYFFILFCADLNDALAKLDFDFTYDLGIGLFDLAFFRAFDSDYATDFRSGLCALIDVVVDEGCRISVIEVEINVCRDRCKGARAVDLAGNGLLLRRICCRRDKQRADRVDSEARILFRLNALAKGLRSFTLKGIEMYAVNDRLISINRFLRYLASDKRINRRATQPAFSGMKRVGDYDFLDGGLLDLFFDDGGRGLLAKFYSLFRNFDDLIRLNCDLVRIGSVGAVAFRRSMEDRDQIPLSFRVARIAANLWRYVGVYS